MVAKCLWRVSVRLKSLMYKSNGSKWQKGNASLRLGDCDQLYPNRDCTLLETYTLYEFNNGTRFVRRLRQEMLRRIGGFVACCALSILIEAVKN